MSLFACRKAKEKLPLFAFIRGVHQETILAVAILLSATIITSSCSSVSASNGANAIPNTPQAAINVNVQISPSVAQVSPGGKIQFSAAVTGSSNPAVVWSASGGTISNGLFTASKSVASATITATSAANPDASASANVTLSNLGPTLNYSGYDGPAELPLVYLQTSIADTPAPGSTITVKAGGNLQNALNNANCGDTILLQAGAVFSGKFEIPAKPCDDQHWIIVRTSAPDSALPPEGTRINPCYAGVASLPARPSFTCPSLTNVMAKILFTGPGISGPLLLMQGANHYRFIGLEITRALPKEHLWQLIVTEDENVSSADHLIFDRVWVHGTPTDETKGGIHLSGITSAAVIDSYFTYLHCISRSGSCIDSQAVNGGEGSTPGGPYKIDNNFLEASGQSIMFGGGGGSTTPADIEIRFNHFFKPSIWQPGAPGFVGGYTGDPFVVKNNLEFKNAQRVLVEGNILQNVWGGFTQHGFSIVLTPVTQNGVCLTCEVTDITIRYNQISNVAGGFDIGNVNDGQGPFAIAGERYSIHDVLLENVNKTQYKGYGLFALLLSSSPKEVLNNLSMQHNTAFPDPDGHIISILDAVRPMPGFVFANNLILSPPYPVLSAGGGSTNCAASDVPITALETCFPGYVFAGNLLVGDMPRYPAKTWPAGQTFLSSVDSVGFVNYAAGDYALSPSSPFKGKATDGLDVGADIDGLNNILSGVE